MYEYRGRVTNVVDGDTVDCEVDVGFHIWAKCRFRLRGIDTPEVVGKERVSGRAATAFVERELNGRNVLLRTYKGDAFGRWLCDIYILPDDAQASVSTGELCFDASFNQRLIDEGYAREFLGD